MQIFNDIVLSIKSFGSAYRFIKQHGLWKYFFYPLLIAIALAIAAYFGIEIAVEDFNNWGTAWLDYDENSDDWFNIGKGALAFASKYLLRFGLIIIYFTINKYLVLMLVSPVLALLSEKVDEILTGNTYPFDGDQFFRDVVRGIFMAIRNMFFEFGVIIITLIGSLIFPFISPFTAVFLMLVEFYFYGFSLMDYTNERKRMKVRESIRYVRKNKGLAIGNGAIFSAIFLIPVLGMIVAPVLSVVAATLAINKKESKA